MEPELRQERPAPRRQWHPSRVLEGLPPHITWALVPTCFQGFTKGISRSPLCSPVFSLFFALPLTTGLHVPVTRVMGFGARATLKAVGSTLPPTWGKDPDHSGFSPTSRKQIDQRDDLQGDGRDRNLTRTNERDARVHCGIPIPVCQGSCWRSSSWVLRGQGCDIYERPCSGPHQSTPTATTPMTLTRPQQVVFFSRFRLLSTRLRGVPGPGSPHFNQAPLVEPRLVLQICLIPGSTGL